MATLEELEQAKQLAELLLKTQLERAMRGLGAVDDRKRQVSKISKTLKFLKNTQPQT